jgi:hypothetical protein
MYNSRSRRYQKRSARVLLGCTVAVVVGGTTVALSLVGGERNAGAVAGNGLSRKLSLLEKQIAEARSSPRAPKSALGPPPNTPTPIPPTRIIMSPQSPYPQTYFLTENSWVGQLDGDVLDVIAGAQGPEYPHSAGSAGVVVFSQPAATFDEPGSVWSQHAVFDPSVVRGALLIVSVAGSTMTFESVAGDGGPGPLQVVTKNINLDLANLSFSG